MDEDGQQKSKTGIIIGVVCLAFVVFNIGGCRDVLFEEGPPCDDTLQNCREFDGG
jgi:hypothetical protein